MIKRAVLLMLLTAGVSICQPSRHLWAREPSTLPSLGVQRAFGVLPNGFQYIIDRRPGLPLTLRLSVGVGSAAETPDQNGVAHLIEHLAFNETRGFSRGALRKEMARANIYHGVGLTGHTGLFETTFGIDIGRDSSLTTQDALVVLHEWADGIVINQDAIDLERGVVLSEGAGMTGDLIAYFLPYDKVLGTRRAESMSLHAESVKSVSVETVREFHRKWYRPSLMKLVVVGDVDVGQWERELRAKFSDLRNPQDIKPAPQPRQFVRQNLDRVFVIPVPEASAVSVRTFVLRALEPGSRSATSAKENLKSIVATNILAARADNFQPGSTELMASANDHQLRLTRWADGLVVSSSPAGPDVSKSVVDQARFIQQLQRFQISQDELQKAKKAAAREISKRVDNGEAISEFYLNLRRRIKTDDRYTGLAERREMLASITVEEMRAYFSDIFRGEQRTSVSIPASQVASFDIPLVTHLLASAASQPIELPRSPPTLMLPVDVATDKEQSLPLPVLASQTFMMPQGRLLTVAIPEGGDFDSGLSLRAIGPTPTALRSLVRGRTGLSGPVGLRIDTVDAPNLEKYFGANGLKMMLSLTGENLVFSIKAQAGSEEEVFAALQIAMRDPQSIQPTQIDRWRGIGEAETLSDPISAANFNKTLRGWSPATFIITGRVEAESIGRRFRSVLGGVTERSVDESACFPKSSELDRNPVSRVERSGKGANQTLKLVLAPAGANIDPICLDLLRSVLDAMILDEMRYRRGVSYAALWGMTVDRDPQSDLVNAISITLNDRDSAEIQNSVADGWKRILSLLAKGEIDRDLFEEAKLSLARNRLSASSDAGQISLEIQNLILNQQPDKRYGEGYAISTVDYTAFTAMTRSLFADVLQAN